MTPKSLLSVDDLEGAGLLAPLADLYAVEARYSVAVTPEIAMLIDRGDPQDPIARQFLPDARELVTEQAELADPIGDAAHSPMPGLVHRYDDRVLLKLVTVCPVYCRFCFRRETVGRGKGGTLGAAELAAALDYVAARPQIAEVILTGGDPFTASARRLAAVAQGVAQIPHVAKLRLHTRVPTAAPGLVTPDRLEALRLSGKALYVALHVNHPRELGESARAAIARLKDCGATLLTQTVLLSGVNDDAETLATLMRALIALGAQPYYLHHPDLAPGTAHFRLPLSRGRKIYAALAQRLEGAALPRYVLDLPGGYGKVPIEAPHFAQNADGSWRVADRFGAIHQYNDACAHPRSDDDA
jgi:lysine 2,3-aminomutase